MGIRKDEVIQIASTLLMVTTVNVHFVFCIMTLHALCFFIYPLLWWNLCKRVSESFIHFLCLSFLNFANGTLGTELLKKYIYGAINFIYFTRHVCLACVESTSGVCFDNISHFSEGLPFGS